jgi:hypothetical protein
VNIGAVRASTLFQFDFLIAAKLIHLVSDVVFEALDVLLVGTAINKQWNVDYNSTYLTI